MLEWHRRHQEAYCILESLLCRGGPLLHFGPSLQETSQSSQNLCIVGQKAAVEVYHAKKSLKLFDILRGWAKPDFDDGIGQGGRSCRRNCVAKNLKRRSCNNAFFKVYGETIGGQSFGKKKPPDGRGVVPYTGERVGMRPN